MPALSRASSSSAHPTRTRLRYLVTDTPRTRGNALLNRYGDAPTTSANPNRPSAAGWRSWMAVRARSTSRWSNGPPASCRGVLRAVLRRRGGQQPYQLLSEPVVDVCPPRREQPAVGEFRPRIDVDRRHGHRSRFTRQPPPRRSVELRRGARVAAARMSELLLLAGLAHVTGRAVQVDRAAGTSPPESTGPNQDKPRGGRALDG